MRGKEERALHVIMPMAGEGIRFRGFYKMPKPLIPVGGIPMYQVALSSLKEIGCDFSLTCVIRKEHDEVFSFASNIKKYRSDANIVILNADTRGSVESCFKGSYFIEQDEGLLALDCDLWFESPDFLKLIRESLSGKIVMGGALLYFDSEDPRYSYAELSGGRVIRTAEKKVISSNALVGAYFFSMARDFLNAAGNLLKKQRDSVMKEYYISFLYNYLIEDNMMIRAEKAREFKSFGTPGELIRSESE